MLKCFADPECRMPGSSSLEKSRSRYTVDSSPDNLSQDHGFEAMEPVLRKDYIERSKRSFC